jgi:hypothetical protein
MNAAVGSVVEYAPRTRQAAMKAMNLIKQASGLRRCVVVLVLAVSGCAPSESTEPEIPFQGPLNASFEEGINSWTATFATRPEPSGRSFVDILSGTGFMPTNGVRYAYLESENGFSSHPASIFQDNVDLTHSTTLSFGYSLAGTLGQGGGTATLQVLFTSNGTQTLWTRTIDAATTLPIQNISESITLPASAKASAGRLTITLVSLGGSNGSVITQTRVTAGVDNIVVR